MKVEKVMTTDVVSCRTTDTLERAAQLMWEHDIGCVVVLDAEDHLAGIVTDRDVCMAAYTRGVALRDIPVTIAMATTVHACEPDQDLPTVEREMGRHQVRRMPVVDGGGRPIGMVSLNDIARAAQHHAWISPGEVASTLAAVSEPRHRALMSEPRDHALTVVE